MLDLLTGQPILVEPSARGRNPTLFSSTGITDALSYREARRAAVNAALAAETDPQQRAGLVMRKERLDAADGAALMWGPAAADFFVGYDYKLRNPDGVVADPGSTLPAIDVAAPWRAAFSCGAWDADGLAGFVTGSLLLSQVTPS